MIKYRQVTSHKKTKVQYILNNINWYPEKLELLINIPEYRLSVLKFMPHEQKLVMPHEYFMPHEQKLIMPHE